MDLIQILSILLSVGILFFVIESIRRGLLKEKYALLWLFASIGIFVLSVWRGLLDIVAHAFGFYYSPSFLFLVGFGFLHLIALHFSIVISTLTEKNKRLAQELGIVKEQMNLMEKSIKKCGLSSQPESSGNNNLSKTDK